ncbi:MAG: hypothetical protein DI535_27195 [Citrobacter freundii]|nr:MAG: hypothetical protein DI535_27195 [Citrobacter freundii]
MLGLPSYDFQASTSQFDYEFKSIGEKGIIEKVAIFDKIEDGLYNFGFGDRREDSDRIDDSVVSANGDTDMVLATAAHIIVHFLSLFPDAAVIVEGSSKSRTRLYQQGLNKYWKEISTVLEILALEDNKWIPFEKGRNFTAFLARRISPD